MAEHNVLKTPRLPDSEIIRLLDKLTESFQVRSVYAVLSYKPRYNVSRDDELLEDVSANTFTLEGAEFDSEGFSVSYRRGVSDENWNDRESSALYDEIKLSFGENPKPEPKTVFSLRQLITSQIPSFDTDAQQRVPSQTEEFVQTQFAQLQAHVTAMADRFDSRQAELDEYRRQLEREHAERLNELAEQRKELKLGIEKERTELDELRKELDDRDYMHVRRQLREKITERIKTRLKEPFVSPRNQLIGLSIVLLSVFTSTLLALFSYEAQQQLTSSSPVSASFWTLMFKSLISGAGAVVFIVYAISWLRKTYIDNVAAERDLERYSLDMDRASWSIETLMELSKQDQATVPTAWVEGVCNGLFSSEKPAEAPSSLQALGAIMGVAGEAEVGPEGAKIKLNRRGTKAVAKEVEE